MAPAVVHSGGAGALLLVAFVLAALRWGTWRTCRRSIELVAIVGVALVALVAILQGRPAPRAARARRVRRDRPDDDDRAFERWQRERWREASKRESVEGFGRGFGGKG